MGVCGVSVTTKCTILIYEMVAGWYNGGEGLAPSRQQHCHQHRQQHQQLQRYVIGEPNFVLI